MNIQQRYQLSSDLWYAITGIPWTGSEQEPDCVAKLVYTLPGAIKNSLNTALPGRQIAAGGAFIHQKPIVHFVNKPGLRDPELGDLLIVCRERRASGVVYNAMLLQAKVTDNVWRTNIPRDHQHVLYSEWPIFEYKRAGVLTGKRRNIFPKTITQGAQYLLIYKNAPCNMWTATVDIPLRGSSCFASTLASIISFDEGRTFQTTSPRDDWSQMILDLLQLAATSVFNRRNSGFAKAKRWAGPDAFDFILNLEQTGSETEGQEQTTNSEESDAGCGVSVICIDLGNAD